MADETTSGRTTPSVDALTREQLYELVWSKPISQILRDHGLSRGRFVNLCTTQAVPIPSFAYWTKKRCGKAVSRRPLPKLAGPATQPMSASATPAGAGNDGGGSPAEQSVAMDVDVAQTLTRLETMGRITMPDTLDHAHALVRKTHHELTRQQRKRRGSLLTLDADDPRLPPFGVDVSSQHLDRALRMLDVIVRTMEALGSKFEMQHGWPRAEMAVAFLGESFRLRVREKITTRPFDKKKDKRDERSSGPPPSQVWERTGRLAITLKSPERFGSSKSWLDTEARRLDPRLARVVAGMIEFVQDLRNERAEQRRRQEDRRREDEARALAERERRVDVKRVDALLALASRFDQADQVRRFVAACRDSVEKRTSGESPAAGLLEWLEWAERVADRVDPLGRGVGHARNEVWNVSP